ncbi:MAG TPA: hypothetical protein PKD64_04215 [Pirellulaceae bacterium]|nr:hypothetical protein [Pirellulaceae bacterium]HMO91377.1 hypothetical protein [Pirellulaceae bacterium]HMP69602.1 hypothetical protein [Pirellulaceae bacterium]
MPSRVKVLVLPTSDRLVEAESVNLSVVFQSALMLVRRRLATLDWLRTVVQFVSCTLESETSSLLTIWFEQVHASGRLCIITQLQY